MRKFVFFLTALCSAFLLSLGAFAETYTTTAQPPSTGTCIETPAISRIEDFEAGTLHTLNTYILSDNAGVFDQDQRSEAMDSIQSASELAGFNVGVVITDDVGSDKSNKAVVRLADKYYDGFFGENTDGVLLLINNDTNYDVISTSGRCIQLYTSSRLNEVFDIIDVEISSGDFLGAVQSFCGYAAVYAANDPTEHEISTGDKLGLTVEYTKSGTRAVLYDPESLLVSQTESLMSLLSSASEEVGYNVCAAVVSDVGSDKSDRGVELFADDLYDRFCGKYTDGILLLINNDTNYDYLTTSGSCIELYTSRRIDGLFDVITPIISRGDYSGAITSFCTQVKNAEKTEETYTERYYEDDYSDDVIPFEAIEAIFPVLVFSVIIFIVIVQCVKNAYTLRPNKGAKDYIWRSSLKFSEKSDTFLHAYTTTTHVSSSKSHRSGGHHSGHSHGGGGHHRSGGGRSHGGGGRHR